MANCPQCQTPGAYVGFSSIECRNMDCPHFVFREEKASPDCGQEEHSGASVSQVGSEEVVLDQDDDQDVSPAARKFDPRKPWGTWSP